MDKIGFTTDIYKKYIKKFYNDKQFNSLYKKWIDNKEDRYLKPSLDHIVSKSKNGELNNLDNLQFLSWFENRCKNDMTSKEWDKLKQNINNYLI